MLDKSEKLNNSDFENYINVFSRPLVTYAEYALAENDISKVFNTIFLGKSHSVSSRLEEVLDHYNALNNIHWRSFREYTAAIKLFTNVAYITLHLKSASPKYFLLNGIDVFLNDTEKVLEVFYSALKCSFDDFIKYYKDAGLDRSKEPDRQFSFLITPPQGILEPNVVKRHINTPEEVIVNLATSYLNLASESNILNDINKNRNNNLEKLIPEVISENRIRILETKYHNLQSKYDTYIANSDIENIDKDLKMIRGHVSIVYHLLEASTDLIHFYERHMMKLSGLSSKYYTSPVDSKEILEILIDYFLNYANQFLTSGVTLCREVIRKYAEEGSITVQVPEYRGFHVRPSTLVAKIIQHYGSEVYLVMDNEKYDAAHPMELFCVNEKINAEKRRNLSQVICKLNSISDPDCSHNFERGLRNIFYELLEENKIINYSPEFALPDFKPVDEETLGEFANRAIAFLLAQGKIDLKTDLTVTFKGDKRVLADLELLAKNGYGEDCYGNNIVLPKELSYIRRS